eukprot:12889095-Prorocentrum_lima.AAC.1
MIPHRDANNLGPSWTISTGDCQGGLLWVESKEGRSLPRYAAPGLGPSVKRSNRVTKGKWLNFDGTKWHGVTPTK